MLIVYKILHIKNAMLMRPTLIDIQKYSAWQTHQYISILYLYSYFIEGLHFCYDILIYPNETLSSLKGHDVSTVN